MKGDFSVLVVRGCSSKIRSIPAPRFLLAAVAVLSLIGVLSMAFVCVGMLSGFGDRAKFERLSSENALLRKEVETLDRQVADLEEKWRRNLELEGRMRLQANLGEVDEETRLMGVGGPWRSYGSLVESYDRLLAASIISIKERTDQLLRQCEFQRSSYLEIIEALSEQHEAWNRIPSISPIREGYISSGFGRRVDPFTKRVSFHEGIDISARQGTPVFAPADGRVESSNKENGFGLTLVITHGNAIQTIYAHNLDMLVAPGQNVKRGQIVARVGNSGRSTAPHLHYEVRVSGRAVNPLTYVLPEEVVVD